ncbi:hypothetical protein D3C86_992280 [compost metagenome]
MVLQSCQARSISLRQTVPFTIGCAGAAMSMDAETGTDHWLDVLPCEAQTRWVPARSHPRLAATPLAENTSSASSQLAPMRTRVVLQSSRSSPIGWPQVATMPASVTSSASPATSPGTPPLPTSVCSAVAHGLDA